MHNFEERIDELTAQLSELKKGLSGKPIEFDDHNPPAEPYGLRDVYELLDDIIIAMVSLQKSVTLKQFHALEDQVELLKPRIKTKPLGGEQQQDLFTK